MSTAGLTYGAASLALSGIGQAGLVSVGASSALRLTGIALGTGAYLGSDFAQKHHEKYGAGVLLLPYDDDHLASKCTTLGLDPYEHWFFRDRSNTFINS